MKKNNPLAFFVTGTDTEIGKTLVSSTILHCLAKRGLKSVGMKPVAAGAFLQDGVWCNEDVMELQAASNVEISSALTNPYLFKPPIAPHIAAQLAGESIRLGTILECYQQLTTLADAIVVEGVGGFYVPLNEQDNTADMAQQLNLPVILVVGMRLGCINHALLTAAAIAARGLTLAGWVANNAQEEMPYLSDNVRAIQERLSSSFCTPLLGCIPWLKKPTPVAAESYLDLTSII